jgi:hypothetical protein
MEGLVRDRSSRATGYRHRRSAMVRRLVAVVAALAMTLLTSQAAFAATGVTVKDAAGLRAVGPTSSDHGFPTWYQDKAGERLELCLDKDNLLCGLLPGAVPHDEQPISFPDNFPDEIFYFLASSTLDLPGGGRAVLTSGLEAAFVNGVAPGGQQTFTRIRVVVKGGPASQTITVKHPYGQLTIDTDSTGAGKLVRDVAPSVGNFSLALAGDVGPWLKWDAAAPAGYLGDPAIPHTITGGPIRNTFSLDAQNGTQVASTGLFTVQGKIATNTGVTADSAVVNGDFVDVFATSAGAALEVVGQDGKFPTTIMAHQEGNDRFYARVPITPGTTVTDVTVRNNTDTPPSTAVAKIAGIAVTQASYGVDDAGVGALTVKASAVAPAAYPLTVEGIGTISDSSAATFPMVAPPATVTVTAAGGLSATAPVVIAGGPASRAGTTAAPVGPPAPPNCDPSPCGAGGVAGGAAPTAKVAATPLTAPRGLATVIDGSTSTNATSFSTVYKSGPVPTIANGTTNKPTVTLPTWAAATDQGPRPPVEATPTVVTFTATNTTASPPVSSSVEVTLNPVGDTLNVATARSRGGSDLRVDGTSTVPGAGLILNPPTQVVVYARGTANGGAWVKIGSATVDSTGAFSVRPRPAPAATYVNYKVQTSRGTEATGAFTR